MRLRFLVHADAGIGYPESNPLRIGVRPDIHVERPPFRLRASAPHGLDRIDHQRNEHLLNLVGIHLDGIGNRTGGPERNIVHPGMMVHQQPAAFDHRTELHHLKCGTALAGKRQEILDDIPASHRLVRHQPKIVKICLRHFRGKAGLRDPFHQESREGDNSLQRIIELMGNTRCQVAQRRHLLHLHHLPVNPFQIRRLLPHLQLKSFRPVGKFPPCPGKLFRHLVERARELTKLVGRRSEQTAFEISPCHPFHHRHETFDRAADTGPDEGARDEADDKNGADRKIDQLSPAFRDHAVDLGE